MNVCAACGADNRVGRKFCGRCGAALGITCSACGTANEPDELFCGESRRGGRDGSGRRRDLRAVHPRRTRAPAQRQVAAPGGAATLPGGRRHRPRPPPGTRARRGHQGNVCATGARHGPGRLSGGSMTGPPAEPFSRCRRLPADQTGRVSRCAGIPRQSNGRRHQTLARPFCSGDEPEQGRALPTVRPVPSPTA